MTKNKESGERFIEILEIIYAIIFACGVAQMLEEIFVKKESNNSITLQILSSAIVTIFVLIRFFFAPSKNVKILVDRVKKGKVFIMFYDIPFLLAHSFIFYLMCLEVKNEEIFYRCFFILLFGNAIWLFSIWGRLCKEKNILHIKKWSKNNIVFFGLYIITYFLFGIHSWVLWFIFALLNSTIDISITYKDYLSAD